MPEPGSLLALFLALCAGGVVLACVLPERRQPAALAWIASTAAIVVIVASGEVLLAGQVFEMKLWPLLSLGTLSLAMDRLSALFVLVVGLVFLPVSVFSAAYMRKYITKYNLRYFSILYYGFLASLVLVLVSSDVFLFVLGWEVMSILSYLLVNYEHEDGESTRAGFAMIAMSEAGTIAVVVAFAILVNVSGGLGFADIRTVSSAWAGGLGLSVFLLSFFGFGVKAGLVPLNSWLPRAHPVAPTNVSALLSGVMVNLGIYGILRVDVDLMPAVDVGRGLLVLVLGSATALVGILYATIQSDLKRMLAHSTIENMGIVVAAVGAAMVFSAAGFPVIAGIALITALYHMVNHSLYKTLLFLGSGAVEAAAGTRDLDRLGGLIRGMPWTTAFVLAGVWSIAALPPFNGFVSEWLTLQTILRSAVLASSGVKMVFALCGAALALTVGLAVTCFVKAFAMGFLGVARSAGARAAGEASATVRAPLAGLAILCLLFGVLPTYVIPVLDRTVAPMAGASATTALVPPFFTVPDTGGEGLSARFVAEFHDIGAQVGADVMPGRGLVVLHQGGKRNPVVFAMSTSYTLLVFIALLALTYVGFRLLTWRRTVVRGPAWAGGLRRLQLQATYTATGFSNPVRVVFHAILRPAVVEDTTKAVAEHFRTAIRRDYSEIHIVDRLVLGPVVEGLRRIAGTLRRIHIGQVNAYAAYVLATLLAVLLMALVIGP